MRTLQIFKALWTQCGAHGIKILNYFLASLKMSKLSWALESPDNHWCTILQTLLKYLETWCLRCYFLRLWIKKLRFPPLVASLLCTLLSDTLLSITLSLCRSTNGYQWTVTKWRNLGKGVLGLTSHLRGEGVGRIK